MLNRSGTPREWDWYYGVLEPDELERVRFIGYSYWNEPSGGSRRPGGVLSTLRAGRLPRWLAELGTTWRFEFAAQLATTEVVDDLIMMSIPALRELVLLEGHARLTAIFVCKLQRRLTVRAYLRLSTAINAINQWSCF